MSKNTVYPNLSDYDYTSNASPRVSFKEEIILYMDIRNTVRASIDIIEICEVDPVDTLTHLIPYKMKIGW
jgi:hypothetical protein